jgi:AcrR family transcriptional regulator
MPVTTPRLPAAERRAQILDATKGIAVAQGFHAISIEAVCRAAGVTRPVVYTHFGDLPGLLDALVDRETARALEQLGAVLPRVAGAGDPRERLLAALEAYLRTAERDPDTWRLVLMPPEGAPPRMGTAITQTREAVIGMLTEALRAGPPDPALVARWMDTIADESARLLLTRPAEYPVERAVAAARWLLERIG